MSTCPNLVRRPAALAALFASCLVVEASAQVFLADDPIWEDPDRLDMPAPTPREANDYHDFWINTFGSPAAYNGSARNVNTLGEVPNSSWYTNRHYRERMTLDELQAGPNSFDGPSMSAPWSVVNGKTEGKTLGMQIEDARGDRYLLKFDPPGHVEMTSGAEVIATKLLYALGYNVPENHVVTFDRSRLRPGSDARADRREGEAPITPELIDELLSRAARYRDGTFRALASKILDGDPVGPFFYYGTRPDDGNDVIPHEARRELRGLRAIAAWIDHTDARALNSLDMVVDEGGRRFVRHYLIDFGSTLGAGPVGPKPRWDGHEYIFEPDAILTRIFTLGIAGLDWAAIRYPDGERLGRVDVEHFDPESWRPQYPNAAFRRADAEDHFWAARQVMHFTEEQLRAIVATANYRREETAEKMVALLAGRRDAIGRSYLDLGGGLDRFAVEGNTLEFIDLPAEHGFVARNRPRTVVWRIFDNRTGELGATIGEAQIRGTHVSIPRSGAPFIAADIQTSGAGMTRVYLRGSASDRVVVGIDRR